MSSDQAFSSQLVGGELTIGTFFKSGSPLLAECLGNSLLDFLLIDRQHASPNLETIESVIRSSDLNDISSIVRIPKQEDGMINNILDMGAQGLMIPQVGSEEEISTLVNEFKYAENRSFAMSTRAGGFGAKSREEYIKWVNNDVTIIPQIETKEGVDNVREIATSENVTAIMIGPGDLSVAYDLQPGSPELLETIDDIIDEIEPLDCGIGMYAGGSEEIDRYKKDVDYILLKSDLSATASYFEDIINSI